MASIRSRALASLIRRTRRSTYATLAGWDRRVANPHPDARVPRSVVRRHRVSSGEKGRRWTVEPRHAEPATGVLYLHGGAYVNGINRAHWMFIARLADELGGAVVVPLYGLAPACTYRDAKPFVAECYTVLVERFGADHVTVMGDSAGASIALALAQSVRDLDLPAPSGVVALSPFVDASLTNPAIPAVERRDPWLARPGLREAARLWAGGDEPTVPWVSPINGDQSVLRRLAVVIGTNDVLWPDTLRLVAQAQQAGVPVDCFEYVGLYHDFFLTPVPEARQAFGQVTAALRRSGLQESAQH